MKVKKKLALITTSAALIAANPVQAENQWGLTPYVGADVHSRHMNWGKGLGDNLFAHNAMQGNLYFGVKFSEYFGIEGGYQSSSHKDRTLTVHTGDTVTGVTILVPDATVQYASTSRISGPHISLVASVPVSEEYRMKILGLVGVASLKGNFRRHTISRVVGGIVLDPTSDVIFTKRKNILRMGTGLEHMITDSWGVRASLTWENTNKLKMPTTFNGNQLRAETKNSWLYGLGAFFNF